MEGACDPSSEDGKENITKKIPSSDGLACSDRACLICSLDRYIHSTAIFCLAVAESNMPHLDIPGVQLPTRILPLFPCLLLNQPVELSVWGFGHPVMSPSSHRLAAQERERGELASFCPENLMAHRESGRFETRVDLSSFRQGTLLSSRFNAVSKYNSSTVLSSGELLNLLIIQLSGRSSNFTAEYDGEMQ